jgi:hypothetical protein
MSVGEEGSREIALACQALDSGDAQAAVSAFERARSIFFRTADADALEQIASLLDAIPAPRPGGFDDLARTVAANRQQFPSSGKETLAPEEIGIALRRIERDRADAWHRRDAAALRALIEEARLLLTGGVPPAHRQDAEKLMKDLPYSLKHTPADAIPIPRQATIPEPPDSVSARAQPVTGEQPDEFVAVGRNGQLTVRRRTVTISSDQH